MQPKFGSKKKNKSKLKKAAKRKAAKKALGEDVAMVDSTDVKEDEIDYTIPDADGMTAKSRQRGKMQLKMALKTKVKLLKHTRSKLTKLPAGSAVTKLKVKKELKEAKAGIESGGKPNKSAPADVAAMEMGH